ncbi:MAG TPA: c-type cytochrome domain-containing protein [Opitutaceae bacterium]
MRELATFLGRFHPLWVHLPIGILILLAALELSGLLSRLGPLRRLPALPAALRTFVLVLCSVAACLAAFLGWLLARTGDYDPSQVANHQMLGFAAAGAAILLLAFRRVAWLYLPLLAGALVLLTLAAHAGAKITHGSDYLTAHMPARLGRLLGIAPKAVPVARVVTFDNAAAYEDVIQPILTERCISCHGPAKTNGSLRLDSWEGLAHGGKHGSVIRAGDLSASSLVRRVDLPSAEKGHMPPRGKPQLTDDEITLLEWWVTAGAPRAKLVSSLNLPPAAETILEERLPSGQPPPGREAVLAAAARLGPSLGVLIRPLSADGPWIEVNARPAGKAFGNAQLDALAPLAGAVQWLDLGGTAVTDAGLAAVAPMRRLERLHLDGLPITDAGLSHLSALRRLEYLNLRGTSVTDKGLPSLDGMPRLRSLYVWQTAVTPSAVKALGDRIVDKRRAARLHAERAELDREIGADAFAGNTGETLRTVGPPPPASPPPKLP